MKIYWLFILFFTGSLSKLAGQDENAEFTQAEDLLALNKFGAALQHYQNLLKHDSSNANLNFKIGICYLNSRSQKTKAIDFMNKALLPTKSYYKQGVKKQTDIPIIADEYLGICHLAYNFKQIDSSYETFTKLILNSKGKNLSTCQLANLKMETNKLAGELKEFSACSIHLKIENIAKNHTSSFVNYTSSLSPDQSTIFTFLPDFKNEHAENGAALYEDLKIPENHLNDAKAGIINFINIGVTKAPADSAKNINNNETKVGTSEDSQTILIYKDDEGEANLYIISLNRNKWSAPEKLDKAINTKGWEQNEYISASGNTLYFTSSREGGYGGTDIYKSKKLPNGEWGKATNLGPDINTSYDERAPFIHTDGVTLYFSSNGLKNVGTFDIFKSSLSENGIWSKPVDVGYPAQKIQESAIYPATGDNRKKNASKLPTMHSAGKAPTNKVGDHTMPDNCTVTFVNQKQVPLILLKGKVAEAKGEIPDHVAITITDNETTEIISTYIANSKTGDFLFIMPPERNANITYQADGYLFQSMNIDISEKKSCNNINGTIQMHPITPDSKVILSNIFFDPGKSSLHSTSNVELNNLYNFLTVNPGLTVGISNYMISKENAKNNKSVSKERAQAVTEYLIKKGIDNERLRAKGNIKKKSKTTEKTSSKSKSPEKPVIEQWAELKIMNNSFIKENK